MLQSVAPKVLESLEKAAEAGRKAKAERDPEQQRFWAEMERRWLNLAHSHEQVAQTEAFLAGAVRPEPPNSRRA